MTMGNCDLREINPEKKRMTTGSSNEDDFYKTSIILNRFYDFLGTDAWIAKTIPRIPERYIIE